MELCVLVKAVAVPLLPKDILVGKNWPWAGDEQVAELSRRTASRQGGVVGPHYTELLTKLKVPSLLIYVTGGPCSGDCSPG